jgi:type I restriction enzyme S subunit
MLYIAKALSSHLLEESIRREGRGVGLKNLNLRQVSEFSLPLPPLNEQRRIVEKIEALTARSRRAREALEAIPELLDQFRQSVLAAAFRGDLTADWREQNPDVEPAEALLERIRVEKEFADSNLSRKPPKRPKDVEVPNWYIPESWEKVLTHDLFAFVTSGSRGWAKYYSDEGATFLRVGNLDRNTIQLDLSDIQKVNPPDGAEGIRTKIEIGDILVSITADIGMIGLAGDLGEAYINQHVALARPIKGFSREYLAWYLESVLKVGG